MIAPNTGMLWVKGDLPRRRPDGQDNEPEPPPPNQPSDDSADSDEDEDGEEEGEEEEEDDSSDSERMHECTHCCSWCDRPAPSNLCCLSVSHAWAPWAGSRSGAAMSDCHICIECLTERGWTRCDMPCTICSRRRCTMRSDHVSSRWPQHVCRDCMNNDIEGWAQQGALLQTLRDQRAARENNQEGERASSSTDTGDRRVRSRSRSQRSAETVLPDRAPPYTRCGENCSNCLDRPCSGMWGHDGEHFCDNCGDEVDNADDEGEHDKGDPDNGLDDTDDEKQPDCSEPRPLPRAAKSTSEDEPDLEPSLDEDPVTLNTLYDGLWEEKKGHRAPTEKRRERPEAQGQENEDRMSWSESIEAREDSQLPSEAWPEHLRVPSENPRGLTRKFALPGAPTSRSSSSLCQGMHMFAAFISQEGETTAVKKSEDLLPLPPAMSAEDEAWDERKPNYLALAKVAGTYQGKANFGARVQTWVWVLNSLAERIKSSCFDKLEAKGSLAMETKALTLRQIELIIATLEKKGGPTGGRRRRLEGKTATLMADALELRRCPRLGTSWPDPGSAREQNSERRWHLKRFGARHSDSARCTRTCENTFIDNNDDRFVCFRQCCLSHGHEGFCRCWRCAKNRGPRESLDRSESADSRRSSADWPRAPSASGMAVRRSDAMPAELDLQRDRSPPIDGNFFKKNLRRTRECTKVRRRREQVFRITEPVPAGIPVVQDRRQVGDELFWTRPTAVDAVRPTLPANPKQPHQATGSHSEQSCQTRTASPPGQRKANETGAVERHPEEAATSEEERTKPKEPTAADEEEESEEGTFEEEQSEEGPTEKGPTCGEEQAEVEELIAEVETQQRKPKPNPRQRKRARQREAKKEQAEGKKLESWKQILAEASRAAGQSSRARTGSPPRSKPSATPVRLQLQTAGNKPKSKAMPRPGRKPDQESIEQAGDRMAQMAADIESDGMPALVQPKPSRSRKAGHKGFNEKAKKSRKRSRQS